LSLKSFPSRYLLLRPLALVFLLTAATFVLAAGAVGCSDSSDDKTSSFDIGTGPITNRAKDPISKELVENLVTRKLGDAGAQGQPVIRSITLTPEAGGMYLAIDLNRTASCHAGALVGTSVTMAQQVMSALFRYPDVSRVQMTLYGPTEEFQDKDKQAVRIMVTKESAAKIDWFQFKETTVASLASEYWIEPSVNQSYLQYGSAPITDPALLQEANGGGAATATTPATP
jgi:hypothetical protein